VAINNLERMTLIAELAATGKLKPVIDRSYRLKQIAEAFKYVEQGHKKGNVVITVESSEIKRPSPQTIVHENNLSESRDRR